MDVVVVDAGDMGVRDDDEGEIAESLDAMSEPDWEEGEGEVCGGEESRCGQRGTAMSGNCCRYVSGGWFN